MQDRESSARQQSTVAAGDRYGAGTDEMESQTTTQPEGTMSQAREKAMDTADQAVDKAAEGMESAADTVREKLGSSSGVTGTAATKLADSMEKTSGYLREHDTQEIMEDVDRYIREHPTQAIIGAVAVGFVIGRMLR